MSLPPTGSSQRLFLIAEWFTQVAEEHRRLADHFERPVELQDLEKAWVRLELAFPEAAQPEVAASILDKDEKVGGRHFGQRPLDDFLALDPEEHK